MASTAGENISLTNNASECAAQKPSTNDSCKQPPQNPQREALVPPDGGWGWVVVAGAFYVACSMISIGISFGIIFSDPLIAMGASSTVTAWILNSHLFMWHFSTIACGALCENFGWRPVAFVGYAITSTAFVGLGFATSPLHIFFLFSVIIGISAGISTSVTYLVVPAYFEKYKGAAAAFIMVGVAAGFIVVPPLIRFLINEYTFKGCTLIFGAILANCCVASMVFHPLEWHAKKLTIPNSLQGDSLPTEIQHLNSSNGNKKSENPRRVKNVMTVLNSILHHLKQVQQLRLTLVTVSFAGFMVGYFNMAGMLPFAMEERGYDRNLASWAISVSGISSTVGRIIIALVSDRKWFSRQLWYLVGAVLSGISCITMILMLDSFSWILVNATVWGVATALTLSTFHALMIDVCGRKLYVSGVSLLGFFLGTLSVSIGPFFGLIRDLSSYTWSMSACGALQVVCAALWLLMPCAIRKDAVRNQNSMQGIPLY